MLMLFIASHQHISSYEFSLNCLIVLNNANNCICNCRQGYASKYDKNAVSESKFVMSRPILGEKKKV